MLIQGHKVRLDNDLLVKFLLGGLYLAVIVASLGFLVFLLQQSRDVRIVCHIEG